MAIPAIIAAAGRTLLSTGVKGTVARTAAASLLGGGGGGGAPRPANSSLSMSQNKSGNSPIGQNPQG